MISPLAADLAASLEHPDGETDGTKSSLKAYGQVFSLLNAGISAGILGGPSLAGLLFETFGWTVMAWVLAVISATTVIPIVGHLVIHFCFTILTSWDVDCLHQIRMEKP